MPDVKLPDGSIASFPEGTNPNDMLRAIQQHVAGQQGPGTPGYSSSILPVSVDAQGNPRFDINAGITGSIIRSLTAPGDAYTGKLPVIGSNGSTTPEANARAAEMAALISPVNPAMRAGDLAIPGVAKATTVREKITPPTAQQLKAAASGQYDAARAAGLDITGQSVADLARGIQGDLQSGPGVIAKTAPKTFAVLDELANPPPGGFATIPGIEAARRGLSAISREPGTEGLAAGHAVRSLDDFLSTLNNNSIAPSSTATDAGAIADILRTARGNYAAAQRSNDLTGVLDRANTGLSERATTRAAATYSGTNLDNALRQRVASLLEKPKEVAGFSDQEIAALQQFVEGGALRNAARRIGNLLGGGGGLGQAVTGAIGGAAGGAAGGWPGFAIGTVAPTAIGVGAKGLENALATRALNQIDQLVRSRSPLYQEMLSRQPAVVPGVDRNAFLLRLLGQGAMQSPPMWGAFAPPQPQPSR